jgi:phosphoserine phosphatase RsbU/P
VGCRTISDDQFARSDADAARVRAVERYRVLETPSDRVFTRIARLAARFLAAPMATVSIVDRDRIWFVATHGLPAIKQVARNDGLCARAIARGTPDVVQDTLTDPSHVGNRFVREQQIRFYACAPIVSPDGHSLGTVAVLDTQARTCSDEQLSVLEDLAAVVMAQLELRLSALDALGVERRLRDAAEYARDDAQLDRDIAEQARDNARRARDDARLDRIDAQHDRDQAQRDRADALLDRDNAIRDRDIAEYDRDMTEQYAAVLQRTLLPPSLPEIQGASLASHYHPASARRVGGDFYDVFALAEDRWAFFIGDVEGHGVDAAVTTSLIRYTLRSAALHYSDPTDGLAELNSVLLRELDPRRFCTVLSGCLVARADGQGFQVTIATGGHPPALLIDPTRKMADEIRSSEGMLVGIVPNATFDACDVHLRPGQTLLFYTDGITEARRGTTPFDQDSLAAFAVERAGLGARGLIDELATLIPKLRPDDDIALLAISAR